MDTTYRNILPIVTPFSDLGKWFTTTIYKNWHIITCDTMFSIIWPSKPLSTYTKPSQSKPSCSLHTNTWLITTQFLTQLLTYTYVPPTHGNTPTIATLFFFLPLTTPLNWSWWYWQHDGTPQQAMKISIHPATPQHNNMLPVMLVISEFQFTFLLEVSFDPIIYFWIIYATI